MAKYSGKVGYVVTTEVQRGIWDTDIVEQVHYKY